MMTSSDVGALAIITTTATSPVSAQPNELIASRHCQPGGRSRSQWTIIPDCPTVNAMNTPTEYSGMRAWVSPLKPSSRPTATMLRISTPEVNARRSPRNENWRGM